MIGILQYSVDKEGLVRHVLNLRKDSAKYLDFLTFHTEGATRYMRICAQ
jgi:hypothetical protein